MSNYVLQANIQYNRVKCLFTAGPIPLPPHELIQVTGELMAVHTLHRLKLLFHSVPVALYTLGVHTVGRIYKLHRVVDSGML